MLSLPGAVPRHELSLEQVVEVFGPPGVRGVSPQDVRQAFDCIDLDSNGFITEAELKNFLVVCCEQPQDEDVEEMIRMVDREGRGRVYFEEFYELLCSKPQRRLKSASKRGLVADMVRETDRTLR
jgi:Ca2+-binding EF-hand superfamily protein